MSAETLRFSIAFSLIFGGFIMIPVALLVTTQTRKLVIRCLAWAMVIIPVTYSLTCLGTMTVLQGHDHEEIERSIPIVTLDGTSYISGSFRGRSFMGTGGVGGSISERDYYTVMAADGNGGYKKKRYPASDVTVLFDSTADNARVEDVVLSRTFKVACSPFFLLDIRLDKQEHEYQTVIHIPEGSYGDHQFNVN